MIKEVENPHLLLEETRPLCRGCGTPDISYRHTIFDDTIRGLKRVWMCSSHCIVGNCPTNRR